MKAEDAARIVYNVGARLRTNRKQEDAELWDSLSEEEQQRLAEEAQLCMFDPKNAMETGLKLVLFSELSTLGVAAD